MIVGLEASARSHAAWAAITSVAFYSVYIASWFFDAEARPVASWQWLIAGSVIPPIAVLLLLPLEKLADRIFNSLKLQPDRHDSDKEFENVVTEIAIALAEPVESIQTHESPVANVAMLPCSRREIVVATTGALEILTRQELQALVAAQFAGLRDPWCRLATRAEIMWWAIPALFPLFLVGFLLDFLAAGVASFVSLFIWAFTPRWNEQARDLCADVAAVQTTFDPPSLASAMRKLAEQAPEATRIKFGKWYLPCNPFLVIPRRLQSTTTVSSGAGMRKWTSSDEVRLELSLRADRAEALAQGADPREFTGREFRRRWRQLGR
jgi:Zn-dependent protease with chaperone function